MASHIFEEVPLEKEESDGLLSGETFPFFNMERPLNANLYLGWFRHHRLVLSFRAVRRACFLWTELREGPYGYRKGRW